MSIFLSWLKIWDRTCCSAKPTIYYNHRPYIDKLNGALEGGRVQLSSLTVNELMRNLCEVQEYIPTAVKNPGGGGYFNHSFFWPLLKNDVVPENMGNLFRFLNFVVGCAWQLI